MTAQKHPGCTPSERYLFELLLAVEVLVSFTLFGYIHIPPISITTAFIPILIAGCLLGPLQSTALGLVFGLASMFKASAGYVQSFDRLFSPLRSGMPLQSLLLSVGTRILFGFLVGIAFAAARKSRQKRLWFGVISALAPMVQGVLVSGALVLLFPYGTNSLERVSLFSTSDLLLAVLCVVLVELCSSLWHSSPARNFLSCIDRSSENPFLERRLTRLLLLFSLFIMALTVSSAVYFAQRTTYMLSSYGIKVSSSIATDTLHLQVQFLFATLALNLISVLIMLMVYKYMSYQKYLGELDALTGIMGRRMFLQHCEQLLDGAALREGWFLFLDVDDFKAINDTYGHATGDAVLKGIAACLKSTFGGCGTAGRVSGDEFAVLVSAPLSEQELSRMMDAFLAEISGLMPQSQRVSCSIGACRFRQPLPLQALMAFSDQLLYQAKHQGKRRCVMADYAPAR